MLNKVSIILVVILYLLSDKLSADKVFVDTVEAKQLLMSTTLFDLTVLHDDDFISVTNGAQSVSHNNNSLLATVDELVKSLLHLMLTFSIKG